MLNSIHDNFVWWFLGLVGIALLLMLYGLVSGLRLPERPKAARIRMFATFGLGLIFLILPIFRPFVSSYSRVEDLEITKADKINSQADLVKHEDDQARDLERIKSEVNRLREDVDRMNSYFSIAVQLLSSIVFVTCLALAQRFRKMMAARNDDDLESQE
jgi:hypothetical protein